ncbi:ABC transporter substrate-binding protein [Tessaracoccus caeni]|uniref:ABC transporter substrate-binding protein n=1 Tax=Tessaracoccus caeni TaxID=3031239 RepID=UPI0023DC4543|nr:ABC transporter substrate-binding protein [Tessaracoccus caeni]MDF1486943.1 ABC transporter substrate-binding protein [Tessaracoccus caeni]
MKRAVLAGILAATVLAAGCSSPSATPTAGGSPTTGESAKEQVSIGAVTIVSHPSLDAVFEGVKEGLAEAGYVEGENLTLEFQNPQGDQQTLTNIANTYASSDHGYFVAIATPPAQALAQTIADRPIVFASVTDPVAAGLVESMEAPGGNVTGTSDQIPADRQLEYLLELVPDIKTIGIVYTSSEVNAEIQADMMTEAAAAKGIEVKTAPVINSSEIAQAAESLDVDAYYVGNDNNVVSGIESMVQVAEKNQRLLFTSDADSVDRGAAATLATDYKAQGKQTARLLLKIIDGSDIAVTPVEIQESLEFTVNPEAAKRMGVEISPETLAKADRIVE